MGTTAQFPSVDGSEAGRWAPDGTGNGTHVPKMKFGYWKIRGLGGAVQARPWLESAWFGGGGGVGGGVVKVST